MKIYLVGGAVRDGIENRPVSDLDYVVVGATPEQMVEAGFVQVGKDFPVFIHKERQGEYTLARRWKDGVFTFTPDVTLEEDLQNRDLTINTMAIDIETGVLIDLFGGKMDQEDKVLTIITNRAFFQDPIRILRIARFAARWPDFYIAKSTMTLMTSSVLYGILNDVTPERVWKELSRGLMAKKPSRMLQVLRECGALKVLLPELDTLWGVPQPANHHPEIDTGIHMELAVDYAADRGYELPVRFGVLMHDLGKSVTPNHEWPAHHAHEDLGVPLVRDICERLKVPNNIRKVAVMACREHGNVGTAMKLRHATIMRVLGRCDAFRNPERFEQMLLVSECDYRGRGTPEDDFRLKSFRQPERYRMALAAAMSVIAGEIAVKFIESGNQSHIADAIHGARVSAFKKAEHAAKNQTI